MQYSHAMKDVAMQFVLLDPNPDSAAEVRYVLSEAGHDVALATTIDEACRAAVLTSPDAVLVSTTATQIDVRLLRDKLQQLNYTGPILRIEPGME
ncbi:response regulator transcription factor [Sphaerobacter thermophilus]|uniref:Response regulator receiver protein n=1 Tax=Sphaerobacter thermophilus (strain ATCC 49802 / DSM 20745 / KCCM 41009 / NCIMB 13125 / S 6022) TaxID=479434 RepID=D1C9C3_SPHTD|nr:response regulator transcription factor [Sphaerobacter thermophilus]ACZ40416.1 response regulator receiver protein [Sphaerobacter thermophilus DSM 20745]